MRRYRSPASAVTSAFRASATAVRPSGMRAWMSATVVSTLSGTGRVARPRSPTSFTLPCP